MKTLLSDYLIVGAGVAGLFCALKASSHGSVSILTRDNILISNTALAQGGIAAALEPGDSPLIHLRDTLAAGAGAGLLVRTGKYREGDEARVSPAPTAVVEDITEAVAWLLEVRSRPSR